MEPQSVPQLAEMMRELRRWGPIETVDNGSQGIGKTLEEALNIRTKKGRRKVPKIGSIGVHFKAQAIDSTSPVTLFSQNPDTSETGMGKEDVLRKFGKETDRSKYDVGCYDDVNSPTNDWDVDFVDGKMRLWTPDGKKYGHWSLRKLRKRFKEGYRLFMFALAAKPTFEDIQFYHYRQADLYYEMDLDVWEEMLRKRNVKLEFRLAGNEGNLGGGRDGSVGFRMRREDFEKIYGDVCCLTDERVPHDEMPDKAGDIGYQSTFAEVIPDKQVDPHDYQLFQMVNNPEQDPPRTASEVLSN